MTRRPKGLAAGVIAARHRAIAASWSLTPRNTAIGGGTASPIVITVPSTTAGDLGIVIIALSGPTIRTITPPSGWLSAGTPEQTHSQSEIFVFYNPNMTAGVTSLSFTVSGTYTNHAAEYFAHAGNAGVTADGYASAGASSSTLPAITSGTLSGSFDLIYWVGASNSASAGGVPSGFTDRGSNSSGTSIVLRSANVIGPAAGSTQTAGTAAGWPGSVFDAVLIVGFTL